MKKLIFGFLICMGMTGCNSCTSSNVQPVVNAIGCDLEGVADTAITSAIVSQLVCSNAAAVQKDVAALVQKTNICQPPPTPTATPAVVAAKKPGLKDVVAVATPVVSPTPVPPSAMAMMVCPIVSTSLTSMASGQIPAAWGCTGGQYTGEVAAVILAACNKSL